ncbi:unnamed protein product [Cyprideis torosa]|uniref:Uncharacterized protein n=1 Tax=Cyprideis torosa TaxID=163714 RepID=A0A7R8ZKQ0_9CRUS|nr:unnamed protein product [Cyprideis torosa]CAG0880685.1 unnamed protein product [Cyprideis torosa]
MTCYSAFKARRVGTSMPDISPRQQFHQTAPVSMQRIDSGDIYKTQSQTSSATDSTEANSVILNQNMFRGSKPGGPSQDESSSFNSAGAGHQANGNTGSAATVGSLDRNKASSGERSGKGGFPGKKSYWNIKDMISSRFSKHHSSSNATAEVANGASKEDNMNNNSRQGKINSSFRRALEQSQSEGGASRSEASSTPATPNSNPREHVLKRSEPHRGSGGLPGSHYDMGGGDIGVPAQPYDLGTYWPRYPPPSPGSANRPPYMRPPGYSASPPSLRPPVPREYQNQHSPGNTVLMHHHVTYASSTLERSFMSENAYVTAGLNRDSSDEIGIATASAATRLSPRSTLSPGIGNESSDYDRGHSGHLTSDSGRGTLGDRASSSAAGAGHHQTSTLDTSAESSDGPHGRGKGVHGGSQNVNSTLSESLSVTPPLPPLSPGPSPPASPLPPPTTSSQSHHTSTSEIKGNTPLLTGTGRGGATQMGEPTEGEITSTTTGLDIESLLDGTEATSDDEASQSADAIAIQRQLQGLEAMYSQVLRLLRGKGFQTPRLEGRPTARRKVHGSLSSIPSSVGTRPFKDKRRPEDRRRVKNGEPKQSTTKRFQRLESHVVTLARSVAHLSSEMRNQQLMFQEIEGIRAELAQLRAQVNGHTNPYPTLERTSGNPHRGTQWSAANRKGYEKLRWFFGDERPLVRQFLRRLGLEKYAVQFEKESIGMAEMIRISEDRLTRLGLPPGARHRILQEVKTSFRDAPPHENHPNPVSVYIV